jgi:hypothetical protein
LSLVPLHRKKRHIKLLWTDQKARHATSHWPSLSDLTSTKNKLCAYQLMTPSLGVDLPIKIALFTIYAAQLNLNAVYGRFRLVNRNFLI